MTAVEDDDTLATGAAMTTGNYVILGDDRHPVTIWYDEGTESISLTCSDPRLTDENGEKPGFRVRFNANPASADYHPANFNRLGRYLRQQGKTAPAEAPVHPRHLAQRDRVAAELAEGS
ncbi:hypothetical protein [Amycolatopsis sp. Hca4]|uniref:hypothetical protein n=1 Tax=Amycolatopsis sp. Hca4 TaxID=2742131 RepID=UPI0015904FF1|nr:hypothetical protein [Amycolatopsis sp. Hca4]QKV73176.1 hypothetical protein HUT10_04720 [Amycolatopsis sp. Hca4]